MELAGADYMLWCSSRFQRLRHHTTTNIAAQTQLTEIYTALSRYQSMGKPVYSNILVAGQFS